MYYRGGREFKVLPWHCKQKRRQLAIKGVLKEGDWIDNPTCVKTEFFHHFSNRFSLPDWSRIPLADQFPSLLSLELANDMEVDVTSDEIKKAVWDCGPDKSLGPDGFTLDFFRRFWSIVGEDVILAVEFFSLGVIPNSCNSSFIALIPKVIDAKLINDFHPISLVGCQYKIIGKILANPSVLVNGSSTEEFSFHRGLRKGDPLSPFLFILVMESLHVYFQRLIDCGLKINVHKSSLTGIGVPISTVNTMASMFGCIATNLPFTYLGVNVGANMKHVSSWKLAVNKECFLFSDKKPLKSMLFDNFVSQTYVWVKNRCSRWWDIQVSVFFDLAAWNSWFANVRLNSLQKSILEASFSSLWWHIWIFRNAFLFSDKKPLKSMLFDNFVSQTYVWVKNRCRFLNCNWVDWPRDPLNAISM
nr:RNA-directed DNA polymerase, eukaryota [Tanacetum cinerariifolium]